MRYYIKCKLKSDDRLRLADSLRSGSLARNKIFYDGMQTALREGTIDENGIVHFIEVCYCLEGGLYPMAMEIPVLKEYFKVKDARLRDQCTMECEFCDCTRKIRLPGKSIANELQIDNEWKSDEFVDMGRLRLNRKKQMEGIEGLRNIVYSNHDSGDQKRNRAPIFSGAAISGLFVIFYDKGDHDYFRIKNIPDTIEARKLLDTLGLTIGDTVNSIKMTARSSLAQTDKRSNVV
ncbi:MAG: hypothetical protein WCF07_00450 [Nitrososphaeraceae archaeon]